MGTGSIFGFLVARDAYYGAIMAPLFIASSLVYGLAFTVLVLVTMSHETSDQLMPEEMVGKFRGLLSFSSGDAVPDRYRPSRQDLCGALPRRRSLPAAQWRRLSAGVLAGANSHRLARAARLARLGRQRSDRTQVAGLRLIPAPGRRTGAILCHHHWRPGLSPQYLSRAMSPPAPFSTALSTPIRRACRKSFSGSAACRSPC